MCFLRAVSVMMFPSMYFVHIGNKSATQNQFEGIFFKKSFKKHVIVLKLSLNDPDWPHFSAWPKMATLKLLFLLLDLPDWLGPVMYFNKQTNVLQKNIFFLS